MSDYRRLGECGCVGARASVSLSLSIYIYIYIYCYTERQREREKERESENRERHDDKGYIDRKREKCYKNKKGKTNEEMNAVYSSESIP